MRYPFELFSVTAASKAVNFNGSMVHTKEHLARILRGVAPTDDNFYLEIRRFNRAGTDKVHVNINELTTSKYPFELHSIAPIIRGKASEYYTILYDNHLIESEEQLRGYFKDTSAKEFEVAYYDTSKQKLVTFRLSKDKPVDTRSYNVGASDYAQHKIQPWDIWLEYDLNPWDADIIKRVLRTKKTDGRRLDYEKIIHICKERIRQLDNEKI